MSNEYSAKTRSIKDKIREYSQLSIIPFGIELGAISILAESYVKQDWKEGIIGSAGYILGRYLSHMVASKRESKIRELESELSAIQPKKS